MTNKQTYQYFCKTAKNIPVFMQPWWMDEVCNNWDVAIAYNGEQISGIWVYPIENKLHIKFIRNPKLTPYLSPCIFYPSDLKESKKDNFEYETIATLLKQLPNAQYWNLSLTPGMKQIGIFANQNLNVTAKQTFILDLQSDEITLLSNINAGTRKNIRLADQEFIVTHSPEHISTLYHFHEKTLNKKDKSLTYTAQDIEKLFKTSTAHTACSLWVATDKINKEIAAIIWQLWDAERSYYFMGGQNPNSTSPRAMTLLLWHAIKAAKKQGNLYFDFEGSMDEGVERFFRNFGGNRTIYLVLKKNTSFLWKMKEFFFR